MNGLKYLRGLRSAEPAKPLQADSPQPPVLDLTRGTAGFASDKAHMASATSYPNTTAANMAKITTQPMAKDPLSMHLLMETAMGDSEHYEVLSQVDLDDLKRELARTNGQLNTARHQLALETKVRDAARAMDKLPLTVSKDFSRPGSKGRGSDPSKDSEQAARKCEELTQEISRLEKEEYRLQRSLLEHTAGVLQMTHKGYLKKDPSPDDIRHGNHIPGLDQDGEFGGLGQYTLYQQVLQNELNGERPTHELADQHQMILDVERKVEDLNAKLRDMILQLRPQKEELPQPPRQLGDDPNDLGEILFDQVDFLEKCLFTVHDLQNTRANIAEETGAQQGQLVLGVEKRIEDLNVILRGMILGLKPRKEDLPNPARELKDDPLHAEDVLLEQLDFLEACFVSMQRLLDRKLQAGEFDAPEDKLESLNKQLFELMTHNDPDRAAKYFPPPHADGTTILDQFEYLQQGLRAVDRRMGELSEFDDSSVEKLDSYQKRAEQYVSVIGGLWDILCAEEHEQAAREGRPPPEDDFSLTTFSKKVQVLHANHHDLLEQKDVLTRQIQQQRELNSTADTTKDQKLDHMRDENDALRAQLQTTSEEAAVHLEKLNLTTAELDAAKNMLNMRDQQAGLQASRGLEQEKTGRQLAEEQLAAQTALAVKAENSLKELEGEVVRLQTELTIAKAELDSAHGTRAQRAAEAAADPALQARVQTLQRELSETIADYEAMTKATIEYEKEREQLEATADRLRDKIEQLETQLAEEKIMGMGAKSPGTESVRSVGGGTSVAVLKTEFRKVTRTMRQEAAQQKEELWKMIKTRDREKRDLANDKTALEKEIRGLKEQVRELQAGRR